MAAPLTSSVSQDRALAFGILVLALCVLPFSSLLADYRFDAEGAYLADATALPGWAHTLERHRLERPALADCIADENKCVGRLRGLRRVITRGANLDSDAQLRLVNRYINKRRYRPDRRLTARSVAEGGEARLRNHWSTLLEFVERGGDCEDYATAKYFLLREFGYQAQDMRVVVSYDRSVREHHAVLALRQPDGTSWLMEMDNTIRKSRQREYRFVYAINEYGIWDHENQVIP